MKNAMSKPSTFLSHAILFTIFMLLAQCSSVQSDASLISTTCKKTPYYGLCVGCLKSDPRGLKADVTGLALIMVDVIKAKSTAASVFIKHQIPKKPALKAPLTSCARLYDTILTTDIPEAVEALQKGNPKFAEGAANDAADASLWCEGNFKGASPMTGLNNMVHQTGAVTSAIVRLLL